MVFFGGYAILEIQLRGRSMQVDCIWGMAEPQHEQSSALGIDCKCHPSKLIARTILRSSMYCLDQKAWNLWNHQTLNGQSQGSPSWPSRLCLEWFPMPQAWESIQLCESRGLGKFGFGQWSNGPMANSFPWNQHILVYCQLYHLYLTAMLDMLPDMLRS